MTKQNIVFLGSEKAACSLEVDGSPNPKFSPPPRLPASPPPCLLALALALVLVLDGGGRDSGERFWRY